MTEETQGVLYSAEEGLARITLNRPEKRNALNEAVVKGITSLCSVPSVTSRIASSLLQERERTSVREQIRCAPEDSRRVRR